MTERSRHALRRDRDILAIGPSSMRWEGPELVLSIRELGCPLPRRIEGEIRVTPRVWGRQAFVLNEHGRHLWHPIAPLATVRLDLRHPALNWQGTGYLDHNRGDLPIADGFQSWTWQRATHPGGSLVAYSGYHRDGKDFGFCVDFGNDGQEIEHALPSPRPLPKSAWRIPRAAHGDHDTRLIKTLEDTPFYARSLIGMSHDGRHLEAVHESLSLDRFTNPVVQAMLPFRMPRKG